MMGKLEAVALLFDIGDTLIDASGIAETALETAARELALKEIIGDKQEFIQVYESASSKTQGLRINHLYSGVEIITKAVDSLGLPCSPLLIGTFLGIYRDTVRRAITENQKLVSLFSQLKLKGFRIGIVTDGTIHEQLDQLYRLGVLEYIDSLSISEGVGKEKPDPIVFQHALFQLNIENAQRAIMVGDSVVRDIDGAARLGLKTILVTEYRRNHRPLLNTVSPDLTLRSALDVVKHVERCQL